MIELEWGLLGLGEEALATMQKELDIRIVLVDGLIVERLRSLKLFHRIVTSSKSVENFRILLFLIKFNLIFLIPCHLKIFDCLLVLLTMISANAKVIVSLG